MMPILSTFIPMDPWPKKLFFQCLTYSRGSLKSSAAELLHSDP